MGMPTPSIHALFTEVWIEYGVSMLVILLRFFARWRMFGFEKFDLGDLFAGLAMVCYSLAAAGTHLLNIPNRSFTHSRPQESTCLVWDLVHEELSARTNYLLANFGNNIGLNEQSAMAVPDSKIADMTMGSKLAYVPNVSHR